MNDFLRFLHVAAAVVWLGGMAFMLMALRPVAIAQLPPPQRLPLLTAVLRRFFAAVWVGIAVLLSTGGAMMATVGMKAAPAGWHAMMGIGVLMCLLFAHLYFAPFARLKRSVAAADWPAAGQQLAKIHPLVIINFGLGWLAVAAVLLWR
jgi:uncharacterized membrane protein